MRRGRGHILCVFFSRFCNRWQIQFKQIQRYPNQHNYIYIWFYHGGKTTSDWNWPKTTAWHVAFRLHSKLFKLKKELFFVLLIFINVLICFSETALKRHEATANHNTMHNMMQAYSVFNCVNCEYLPNDHPILDEIRQILECIQQTR